MMKEPLLINSNPKGGLRTLPFIIANEAFERMASTGLMPNMILYLCREYHMETTAGTNVLFIWSAALDFLPILGAFLADAYVGRFRIIGFGCIACLLGTVLLWVTTIFPQAKPPVCDPLLLINSCESATGSQLMLLYSAFGFMSFGAGGLRASSLAFGAEQLNKGDDNNIKSKGALQSFFNWYYVSVSASYMIAITCIVYIQDKFGWKVGFGIPAVLVLFSAFSFFLASPLYVKSKANTSLITGLFQVIVASSYRNQEVKLLPSEVTEEMYHHRKGSILLMPSDNLRFLNKACVIKNPEQDLTPEDGRASNPWRLCTVDQVEDLKALIKVIPLWSTGIMISVTTCQPSFPVLQASSMDRHIISPNFEIPAGSFSIFTMITLILWISFYDRILLPVASKIKGNPCQLSLKQRMGIGLLCTTASMAAWAIVESIRLRGIATNAGTSDDDDPQAAGQMSAMWLLPYLVLNGLAIAFNTVGQIEFYYNELPKSMSSIATALFGLGASVASLVASFIVSSVDYITTRGGNDEGWIPRNINEGHYDYYYWLLAGLSLANFFYFLACSKAYGPCKGQVCKVFDDRGDGLESES